jgi:hypothetical protein
MKHMGCGVYSHGDTHDPLGWQVSLCSVSSTMNNNANSTLPDPAPSSVMHGPTTDAKIASQAWTIDRRNVPAGIRLPFHFNSKHRVICQCGLYVGGDGREWPGRYCPGSWYKDESKKKLMQRNTGAVIPVYDLTRFIWNPLYIVVCQCGLNVGQPAGLNEIRINAEVDGGEESVTTEEASDFEETNFSVDREEGEVMEDTSDLEEAEDHVEEAEHVNSTGTTYKTAVDLSFTSSTNLDGESSSNALDLTLSDSQSDSTL